MCCSTCLSSSCPDKSLRSVSSASTMPGVRRCCLHCWTSAISHKHTNHQMLQVATQLLFNILTIPKYFYLCIMCRWVMTVLLQSKWCTKHKVNSVQRYNVKDWAYVFVLETQNLLDSLSKWFYGTYDSNSISLIRFYFSGEVSP